METESDAETDIADAMVEIGDSVTDTEGAINVSDEETTESEDPLVEADEAPAVFEAVLAGADDKLAETDEVLSEVDGTSSGTDAKTDPDTTTGADIVNAFVLALLIGDAFVLVLLIDEDFVLDILDELGFFDLGSVTTPLLLWIGSTVKALLSDSEMYELLSDVLFELVLPVFGLVDLVRVVLVLLSSSV